MSYRIEFEFVCACCFKKQYRSAEFESAYDANVSLYQTLQSLAENENANFASIQKMWNGKVQQCFFVIKDEIRFVSKEKGREEVFNSKVREWNDYFNAEKEVA